MFNRKNCDINVNKKIINNNFQNCKFFKHIDEKDKISLSIKEKYHDSQVFIVLYKKKSLR